MNPDPGRLMRLATSYWESAALLAANDMGVFAALGDGPLAAEALAARLGADARAVAMLARALVGLGLLREEGGRFANSDEATAFLVPGRPGVLAGALGWAAQAFPAWARLGDAVRSGRPVVPAASYLGGDAAATRRFVRAMHERGLGLGSALAVALDLSGRRHLADVGGGPGTLAALLVKTTRGLAATVLDLAPVVEVAREVIAEMGAADRVRVRACDVLSDPLGGPYDAMLVSGLLHREDAATCRALLARARDALVPGGAIHVCDLLLDADRARPSFVALFALHMLLTSERGGAHSVDDVRVWLAEAGFSEVRARDLPPPHPHRVVSAVRSG